MKWIRHRMNRASDLKNLRPGEGAEIDLRSDVNSKGRIHLSHDAWNEGDDFETWLKVYSSEARGTLILNTKEDGLEGRVLELLKRYHINDYFFLDTQIPTLIWRHTNLKETHFAARLSIYEPQELARCLIGRADWLWLDGFGGKPLDVAQVLPLKEHFKLCLVSPELLKQPLEAISQFKELGKVCDAICTKSPEAWSNVLEFS
jgi:hypothetical protein